MPDYFDEIADMLANSVTVGTFYSRDYLIAMLRSKFETEAELRTAVNLGTIEATRMADETLARAKAAGAEVVGVAVPISITCPRCAMTSHNLNDVAQGWCDNCKAYTSHRPGRPAGAKRH